MSTTLTAGLELDRQIAEMLGWQVVGDMMHGDDDYSWASIPHYSTNANAALSLVEGMGLHSWSMHALQKPRLAISWTDKGVCVDLHPFGEVMAETLPLAICKAWLMNLERERAYKAGGV